METAAAEIKGSNGLKQNEIPWNEDKKLKKNFFILRGRRSEPESPSPPHQQGEGIGGIPDSAPPAAAANRARWRRRRLTHQSIAASRRCETAAAAAPALWPDIFYFASALAFGIGV